MFENERIKIMRVFLSVVIGFVLLVGACNQTPNQENEVRQAVQSFYNDFNSHNFGRVVEYTTEDWNHINPFGGITSGREPVLKELKEVHESFLKGVSSTIEDMSVRFAAPEVAVVIVTNRMGTYTTPDAVKHENERQIKTFVVVKRNGKWLIMHDQNTLIGR